MDIYYINLATRSDRRASMERQFAALGLSSRRVEAIAPPSLTPEQKGRYCDPLRLRWLTETELCCNLSHLTVMRQVLSGTAERAAVFEDDVRLSPAVPEVLQAIEEGAPASQLIRLETDNKGVRLDPAPEESVGRFALHRAFSPTSGAAGYVVTRAAAAAILESRRLPGTIVDHALFNPYERLARELRMRHLVPAVCAQWDRLGDDQPELSRSDLEADRRARPRMRRSLAGAASEFVEREFVVGPQQLFHRLVRRASKRIVPFLSSGE